MMLKSLASLRNNNYRICWRQLSINTSSSTKTTTLGLDSKSGGKQFTSFNKLISQRRDEASRSFLVQVSSDQMKNALITYCGGFGHLKNCFYFQNKRHVNYCLMEFKTQFAANSMMRVIRQAQPNEIASSMILKFSPESNLKNELSRHKNEMIVQTSSNESKKLSEIVRPQSRLEEHVHQLYEETRLNELATRLRFLTVLQIEATIGCLFPALKVLPFGSSVNGFGRMGSDLDVVLRFDQNQENTLPLKILTKAGYGSIRTQHMIILQTTAKILENLTPGVENMQSILNARVPILKFRQEFLDLDVDLCAENLSGVYMSELLYIFGEIDERVRPLIFFLRRWAEKWYITRVIRPGPWISNFMLSCLVLFFLQQLKQPILPSVNELKRQALPSDKRVIDQYIDCTFLRDITRLKFKTTNTDSLEELIVQFFDFCAKSNFEATTISLNTGNEMPGANAKWPMHIINPLELELNVSANVSREEVKAFRRKAKEASEKFQELARQFSASTQGGFVDFFQYEENNDFRSTVLSKMNNNILQSINHKTNASVQRSRNPKKTPRRNTLSVRELTELK